MRELTCVQLQFFPTFRDGSVLAVLEIGSLIYADKFNASNIEKNVQAVLVLAVQDSFLSSIPVDPERVIITSVGLGNMIDACVTSISNIGY